MATILRASPELLLLNVTGLKRVTDSPLTEAAALCPKLRVVVAKSANSISDELLGRLCDDLPGLVAMNYYGDIIGSDADAPWGASGTVIVGKYRLEY